MSLKVSVVLAAGLLIAVFVVGILVGRAGREKPRPIAGTSIKTHQGPEVEVEVEVKEELAACQEELHAHSMLKATSSAATPDEPAVAEAEAKAKALEQELRQCKKRNVVFNADMCTADDRYGFALYLVVLHADKGCVDKFGVGDLILKHNEQCAQFEDQRDPKDMDLGELSDAELSKLYRAQHFGKRTEFTAIAGDHKANNARFMKRLIRECRMKYGLSDE